MTSSEVFRIERDGHVGVLWLARPERRNAMGTAFFADLPRMMEELAADREVRAVVLAAHGPHFCVGLDLKSPPIGLGDTGLGDTGLGDIGLGDTGLGSTGLGDTGSAGRGNRPHRPSRAGRSMAIYRHLKRLQASITSVADCPKPVIAAIQGYCVGGGVDLIATCDIRLASSDAVFSVREIRLAIVADLGTLQRLPRIVPSGAVAELAYTGKDLDAERARAIGLVNDVLPDHASLFSAAMGLAREIAANSPLAVQGVKAVLGANEGRSVADGLDYVATWNAAFLASRDLGEALAAFVEGRPARFEGD